MPFRDDGASPQRGAAIDPLSRFAELFAAFEAGRTLLGDRAPLRLAAVALVVAPGDARELAARVRAQAAELDRHYRGWTSSVGEAARLVLAAALVRVGESVEEFVAATRRVQALMHAAGIRPGGLHEVLSAQILRRVLRREPTEAYVERMQGIYERMKHHHWLLTGPEDLAACAMLVGRRGTPDEVGDHVEAIYARLARAPKIWGGDELQTAASVLALAALAPGEAAARFLAIATALRQQNISIRGSEYHAVAMLAFLPRSAEQVSLRVAAMRRQLDDDIAWHEDSDATSLATSLAFVELLQAEPDARIGALADAKLLLDVSDAI